MRRATMQWARIVLLIASAACGSEMSGGRPDADTGTDADARPDADADADVLPDAAADADAVDDAARDVDEGIADYVWEGDGDFETCSGPSSCLALAHAMLDAMNADREAAGCGPLVWDGDVAAAAQDCAYSQAAAGRLGACTSLHSRLEAHAWPFTSYYDVAQFYAFSRSMSGAERQIVSYEHADRYLLNCTFTVGGVGIAPDGAGGMYFCQVYVLPIGP